MNRLAVALGLLSLAGCGVTTTKPPVEVFSDMRRQPKYKALEAGPFFSDGRASRPPVPGTVAAERLIGDEAFETGIAGKMYVGRNPRPIDAALLARGRERFDIGPDVIMLVGGRGRQRRFVWHALQVTAFGVQQLIGAVLNPRGNICISRAAIGRIVLQPTV